MSRITYDRENSGALHKELISRINEKISKMPCNGDEIRETLVVGNGTKIEEIDIVNSKVLLK